VRHTTTYRYSRPVRLGDHRLMLRPRDSHDLRLMSTNLELSPSASIRWMHDVFGNSIAIASFAKPATELRIESDVTLETFAVERPPFQIMPEAVSYPFVYSADDRIDLGRMLERQYADPGNRLAVWARGFVRSNPTDTLALLADLNSGIAAKSPSPDTEGTQSSAGDARSRMGLVPGLRGALDRGRSLPRLRRAWSRAISTIHSHHAAPPMPADIYVPGSGWIAYDPTNRTIGGNLIRVAVTRHRAGGADHRQLCRHSGQLSRHDGGCQRDGGREECGRGGGAVITGGLRSTRMTPHAMFSNADRASTR
jgi:hypothetical protein